MPSAWKISLSSLDFPTVKHLHTEITLHFEDK